jgi:hypothetical protein
MVIVALFTGKHIISEVRKGTPCDPQVSAN